MSHELIDRSPDLRKLSDTGYCLRIVDDAFLVVGEVPYVTATNAVQRAELIMVLTLGGNTTAQPADHVAYWSGEHPYHANRNSLDALLVPNASRTNLCPSFPSVLMFSAKAPYRDYFHKVSTYVDILEREARSINETVSARKSNNHAR